MSKIRAKAETESNPGASDSKTHVCIRRNQTKHLSAVKKKRARNIGYRVMGLEEEQGSELNYAETQAAQTEGTACEAGA